MPVVLALLGALLGYFAFDDPKGWSGSMLCSAFGVMLGVALGARSRLKKAEAAVAQATAELEATKAALEHLSRFAHGTANDLHWRLVPVERLAAAANAQPSPPAEPAPPIPVALSPEPAAVAAAEDPVPDAVAASLGSEAPEPERPATEAPATSPAPSTPAAAPPPRLPLPPAPPPSPSVFDAWLAAGRAWFFGGNTILRVGSLVLFHGLAFALRYAATEGYFPLELRYAAVGLSAVGMVATGFWVRRKRRSYGLLLQGVGVAVMYLTVFAAMRLQSFVPLQMGLVLLIGIAASSAVLAVKQDAVGLATAAALGGFAAPILASNGGGSHVALFSYLLLLDAAIVGIAWTKAWRSLNLIGFFGTFGIGSAWGIKLYAPPLFETTQPFVIAAFLAFVGVAVLFARRVLLEAPDPPASHDRAALLSWARKHSHAADATILFGTPLAAYGLEYALVRDRELGPAFAALAMAAFYIALAAAFVSGKRWRYLVLVETFIAIGVIFATLTIPLALDARWTSAAWAIEGAGIYWTGLRQKRPASRGFGLLLQAVAALAYLTTLGPGSERAMLSGSPLGAAILGASLLASYAGLFRATRETCGDAEKSIASLLGPVALAFSYLVVALVFRSEVAAAVWAVLGFGTLWVSLRTNDRAWLYTALLVQALAGAVFLMDVTHAPTEEGVALALGLRGLVAAGSVGSGALASFVLVWRRGAAEKLGIPAWLLGLLLLFALVFVNLGALFVLPWQIASGVWATTGLGVVWLSLAYAYRPGLWFGLATELVGGASFLRVIALSVEAPVVTGQRPFADASFWTPLVISLAALACAYRLHASFRGEEEKESKARSRVLDGVLLTWSTAWWSLAWLSEIERFASPEARPPLALLVTAGTVLAWALVARPLRWTTLARFTALLSPAAALVLVAVWVRDDVPTAHWGALAWGAAAVVHLFVLRRNAALPKSWLEAVHVLGVWWLLGMLALEARAGLAGLAEERNAWRWLGWVVVPLLYLVAMASDLGERFWPIRDFERAYRRLAAAPVAIAVVLWFFCGSLWSDGTAAPLPYVPLVNPLELAQLLSMAGVALWFRRRVATWGRAASWPRTTWLWIAGVEGFVFVTFAVARVIHQWRAVPFEEGALVSSMELQAGLSIVWTLSALTLMLLGNRSRRRTVWIAGAVLVAVVVAKLFLVELSNRGGLERIVSFIGVGVILLVVGYFAPLPPAAIAAEERRA